MNSKMNTLSLNLSLPVSKVFYINVRFFLCVILPQFNCFDFDMVTDVCHTSESALEKYLLLYATLFMNRIKVTSFRILTK